jgi:phosphoribosyl 1,2-cyclic phosphodiesterase
MRLNLCGVRGSTPAPGAEFIRYGGHTSCVALTARGEPVPTLILDAGTGVRRVTALLGETPFTGTILLTHLHWDHVHGLPFFRGGDQDAASVRLVIPDQGTGEPADAVLARGMSPPHFPIGPDGLRGRWAFEAAEPGPLDVAGFHVEAREIPHKGGRTYGYRVSDGTSTIAYIPDHCPTSLGAGPDGWGEYHAAVVELADSVDVLLHDAQLLPAELAAEAAFGHAAADYAVGLARVAGARRVLLIHHRPDRTDAELDRLARRFDGSDPPVVVASEGDALDL